MRTPSELRSASLAAAAAIAESRGGDDLDVLMGRAALAADRAAAEGAMRAIVHVTEGKTMQHRLVLADRLKSRLEMQGFRVVVKERENPVVAFDWEPPPAAAPSDAEVAGE